MGKKKKKPRYRQYFESKKKLITDNNFLKTKLDFSFVGEISFIGEVRFPGNNIGQKHQTMTLSVFYYFFFFYLKSF